MYEAWLLGNRAARGGGVRHTNRQTCIHFNVSPWVIERTKESCLKNSRPLFLYMAWWRCPSVLINLPITASFVILSASEVASLLHIDNKLLVHGRKLIIHWPRAKFLPLINRSVNQPLEVIIHCWTEHSKTLFFSLFLPPKRPCTKMFYALVALKILFINEPKASW